MQLIFSLRNNPSSIVDVKKIALKSILTGKGKILTIASILCIAVSTLYNWLNEYKLNGTIEIPPKKRGRKVGTGRILSFIEEIILKVLIKKTEPAHHNLNFSTWTRRAITQLALLKFNKKLAVRTMGDYLKRWRYSPQKPIKQAHQRNPEAVRVWLEERFPKIVKLAIRLRAIIYFGDEVGVHTESFNNASYAPIGHTPVLKTTGTRLVQNLISAVSNSGILRYMTYSGSMNCKVFIRYLQNIIKSSDGKMVFLVLDNLKVHHGKMVQNWIKNHKHEIRLYFLPPYCPDLNPDEYVNHLIKQKFQSQAQPRNKEAFTKQIRNILHDLQKQPKKLENLFQKEEIEYAAKK
jgi:transposase